MALNWITPSKRLLEAVSLINSTPDEVFNNILIHPTGEYSDEQLQALGQTLNIPINHVNILVQSIEYIMKKANQIIIKPAVLHKNLIEVLKFKGEKANAFVKAWTEQSRKGFGDLDKRKKLDNIAWEINLQGDSLKGRLQLGLSDFNGENSENATLELSEGELAELYCNLEAIQNKLDSLH